MTMDITAIEREALKLSPEDRARLVRELLESLDNLSSQDLERLWLEEASLRAAQLDTGEATLVPGDEVDRKARALLR
jgi:putative addiction module component (TIGR02574 family)